MTSPFLLQYISFGDILNSVVFDSVARKKKIDVTCLSYASINWTKQSGRADGHLFFICLEELCLWMILFGVILEANIEELQAASY